MVETLKYLKGPDNMLQLYESAYQEGLQTFAAEQQGRSSDIQSPQPKMK